MPSCAAASCFITNTLRFSPGASRRDSAPIRASAVRSGAEMLARRYLGTIEGGSFREDFEDGRPPEPDGIVTETVNAGTGERGVFTMRFDTPGPLDPDFRVHLDILEAVLEQRLVTHIREELSASYSPTVSISAVDEPVAAVEVSIRIDGDPEGTAEVRAALLEDLEDLTTSGPTASASSADLNQNSASVCSYHWPSGSWYSPELALPLTV